MTERSSAGENGRKQVSLQQEYELLRRVPFFAEIEPAKLKLLAFMSERVGFDRRQIRCAARAIRPTPPI